MSSPSTCWPLPSIPPLISPFLPGESLSSRVAPNYHFFECLRTITTYVVFQHWDRLLQSIAAAAIRPP